MIHNEATGASATAAIGIAGVIDFGLLNELPKGGLVTALVLVLTGFGWFVRRDYRDFLNQRREITKLKKKLTIIETKLGVHDKNDDEDEP